MVVGLLESNGVRAYSLNESSHGVSHYGGQSARSGALALYRIYVRPQDESTARDLIDGADEQPQVDITPEMIEEASAPSRYSRTKRERTRRLVASVLLLLLAYPIGSGFMNLYRAVFDQ
jgi:hypothetical protein